MLIIPAIDLRKGRVVRLVQGKTNLKVYSSDPLKTAKHWQRQGARLLHIVDLDGAREGQPCHLDILKKILKGINIPVEFGGGIRDIKAIRIILNLGVKRIILGTKLKDLSFLKAAKLKFKEKVIASLDVLNNQLRLSGWQAQYTKSSPNELAKKLKDTGFKTIIYTDILRDGTLKGPNITMIKRLLKETGLNLIAAGGIGEIGDLFKLKPLEKNGLIGVIVGKALYEERFTLKMAQKLFD
ncbi:MAG: 1-(5-phosphoribosyl)-5-[(5-phosphoribosylamino)methylideneamino]imidazole-4-carboxamide isomerase [Candidatus Omnitrophica bacterium]|nr:1-(5-phosphoribosyl)-5-[(5-phosphoribosylamino)methylideneamino]imidazole-4-carboxamide isomerase [Candidatus Omnitrophota bacterium]